MATASDAADQRLDECVWAVRFFKLKNSALARRRWLLLWLLMLAVCPLRAAEPPALLLAEHWRPGLDLADFLVSEKLDGVRGYWDGRRLLTRSGLEIRAPEWFTAALPAHALDGELWMGRGRFDETSAALRRESPRDEEWRQIHYMLFELPGGAGGFAERAAALQALVRSRGVAWLQAVEQFRVANVRELERHLDRVIMVGGEGLMLHRADAPYVTGRSEALLKLKRWYDAEAVVIGHLPGKGRHTGRLGALRVRAADGREFSLGSGFSDAQRRQPPAIGAIVTYRYRELSAKGQPRFASFWRVRAVE